MVLIGDMPQSGPLLIGEGIEDVLTGNAVMSIPGIATQRAIDGRDAVEAVIGEAETVAAKAPDTETEPTTNDEPPQPTLNVVDAFELLASGSAPPRRWHVEDGWMPADDVTLLGADGGEGKTTLAMQLAYCTPWGFPWLGINVRQGPAVYITCEEPISEVHYRLEQIRKKIALPGTPPHPLKIISFADADHDAILASPSGPGGAMQATPLLGQIIALIQECRPKLLVLTLAPMSSVGRKSTARRCARSFACCAPSRSPMIVPFCC